ncbi:hypothetical protein C8T65DRAFT_658005 [Cerioporus squamosus]|nr:hypothetical protein C8T65DRAFT_658005 [Cerioporus squamosus]
MLCAPCVEARRPVAILAPPKPPVGAICAYMGPVRLRGPALSDAGSPSLPGRT